VSGSEECFATTIARLLENKIADFDYARDTTDRMSNLYLTRLVKYLADYLLAVFSRDLTNVFDSRYDYQRIWLSFEFLHHTGDAFRVRVIADECNVQCPIVISNVYNRAEGRRLAVVGLELKKALGG
jgi:hypothetical protein